MDKLIELCLRSIIRNINGDMEKSKEYERLALEEYQDFKSISRIEEHIPGKVKRKLYQIVS